MIKGKGLVDAGSRVTSGVLWSVATGLTWGSQLSVTQHTVRRLKFEGLELNMAIPGTRVYSWRHGQGEWQWPRMARVQANGSVFQGWRGMGRGNKAVLSEENVLCIPNANSADSSFDGNDVNLLASFMVPAMVLILACSP